MRRFDHDPLRRLISATGRESSNVYAQPSWDLNIRPHDYTATNTYTRSFSYDKLGNIQTLNHVAAGHTNQNFNRIYNYGSPFTDNKLESFEVASNTYTYQYDASGNIIQEGANRYYEWTHNDKPATYSNQTGIGNPTVYTNYFYNAAGERVKKHTRKGNRVEVTFYMDGGLFETSYVKPTGTSIDHNRFYNTLHVLDGSSRIATVRVGNDLDDPTPQVKYYLEDHLMDSLVVLNTSGNLVNREEFYPFGETSFGGFAKKRYRFNGKEKDEESGLYYYGQRYYAPWLCRFISVDPIAEKYTDLSSYNYAGNRPVTKIDIDGLQEEGRKETPQDDQKESKAGNNKTPESNFISITAFPDEIQSKIDEAMANAMETGEDIEITVNQTEDGYSLSINGELVSDYPGGSESPLNLPRDPELVIRDQQREWENDKSNSEQSVMDPIPTLPPKVDSPQDASDDRWKLVQTITEGYVDKTERLLKKGGQQLAKAARFFGKVSKGLGWFGLWTASSDAYHEINDKGLTWKTATKATIGIGLALGSIFFAPLAIPAFIYGVADYFGLIDKALDGIERVVQNVGNFFEEVAYKTRKGFHDMEQGLRNGWRPGW